MLVFRGCSSITVRDVLIAEGSADLDHLTVMGPALPVAQRPVLTEASHSCGQHFDPQVATCRVEIRLRQVVGANNEYREVVPPEMGPMSKEFASNPLRVLSREFVFDVNPSGAERGV